MKKVPWEGERNRLTDYDIPRLGHVIGVGEDEMHAVLDVESRGYGYDPHGRVIMLFEPHIFYRELKPAQRNIAVKAGLAYPKWKRNYPKDSYPRLLQAMKINPVAAMRACSWGLAQIMGFNHTLAGFDTVHQMVKAFAESEALQVQGMISFIKNAGLDDELRAHDWAGFASGYNGSGYRKNKYHTRLAKRFAWWQKQPDTKWEPSMAYNEEAAAKKEQGKEDRDEFFDKNTKKVVDETHWFIRFLKNLFS